MAPYYLKNGFIAPTFENGVNGWTVSGTGSGAVTLSTSTSRSLHGTKCLKVTVPAGAGNMIRLVPPSFPMVLNPYRTFSLTFSAASSAPANIWYGFERFKTGTLAVHNTNTTYQLLSTTLQKFGNNDFFGPDNAPYIGGLLPKIEIQQSTTTSIDYYFDGFTWLDSAEAAQGVMYPFPYDVNSIPQISGSWPDAGGYDFSWTGAVEASASLMSHKAELSMPAAFNRGDTVTMTGTGFPASSTVDIIVADWYENRTPAVTGVPTDASGNLTTTFTVPYYHEPGMSYIVGKPADGTIGSMRMQEVWTKPTDLTGTLTNYFPNPNGKTLAADGIRPKHFIPYRPEWGDVVRQITVDGQTRVRIPPRNMADLFETGNGHDLGLVDGKPYVISARMFADTAAAPGYDPWAYIQTSDGNSDIALNGPGPWMLYGIGTGVFDGAGEFITYGWPGAPDPGVVSLDHLSIIEAAMYVIGWNGLEPGTPMDGYKAGMRPGRQYALTGYTYGTYKIRTGTSTGTLTDLLVWDNVNPEAGLTTAPQSVVTIPDGHTVIQLEATGDTAYISVFDYVPYFDGDTPDGDGYTYSWAGAPNDSASIRTAGSTPTINAQVFVGGVAKPVSEMRAVKGGTLTPVSQIGT